ncbi:hypothetical protein Fot_28206 [Forsythia ovata]|uniref:Uncharacterized protein n=1 Tax=Forsythia ovata TaxID=205694 RepID=A0ABD1TP61_9LAMI
MASKRIKPDPSSHIYPWLCLWHPNSHIQKSESGITPLTDSQSPAKSDFQISAPGDQDQLHAHAFSHRTPPPRRFSNQHLSAAVHLFRTSENFGGWRRTASTGALFSSSGSGSYRFVDTRDNGGQFSPYLSSVGSDIEGAFCVHSCGTPSSENLRQSGKRKAKTNSTEGVFRTPVPPPVKRIKIGFRRDELDPTVLGKLPTPAAIAAASVHKYWTPAFSKAADNAELMELLKLAEMYTSRSHMFNCELYKVLAMKVDELRSTAGG